MASEGLEELYEEREYDLELIGNFGRFVSDGSYPIEYLMTSMSMSESNRYLKFARDMQMEEIDFDLLMQRDIDEGRVETDILPYLQPDQVQASTRPLFFPPLLAAIVPIVDEKIQKYYGRKEEITPKETFKGKRWRGHFQIFGKQSQGVEGLPLELDDESIKIKSKQVVLSVRTTEVNASGVMLIVIDGQHRLMALKRLWSEHRDKVRDLVVPVCIMYPPESFSKEKEDITPTVPRVFRELFVDVNSTMKVVGGHFTILLSDKTVGDIACREFCDAVLDDYGREGLSCIEWNTRTKKDSYNVTKKYTSTSIGIIQKGLEENFKADMLVYHLLNITEGSVDIFPEDADLDEYPSKIKWDKFSYAQSNALQLRIRNHVSPLLLKLFFNSVPFRELNLIFFSELQRLKKEVEEGGKSGTAAQAVQQKLLEYKPFDENEPSFCARLDRFEDAVEEGIAKSHLSIIRYALFQRALFNVAGYFVRLGIANNVSVEKAFSGFIELVNCIFTHDRNFFEPSRSYMQYTAFTPQKRIRTREETKAAFRDLILSHLLRKDMREKVLDAAFTETNSRDEISSNLTDRAFEAAGEFLRRYREERSKEFKKGYELDYSLSKDAREDLKLKEMEQKTMEREVKEGKREEASVKKEFDISVSKYVEEYLAEIKAEFREALGVSGDFLEMEKDDDNGDVEEL